MKIVTVIGARPQFIKAAVVSRILRRNHRIKEVFIHTGQHYDQNMSKVFFDEMEIPEPDYNLHIHGLSHGAMTGRMLEGIEAVLIDEKPDIVLVYGDTNSTLAGALAAKKLVIDLAHVEAGLRSHNLEMPEEINRILTDRISDLLLCPTKLAEENLIKEGFDTMVNTVRVTGDVMYDAALFYADKSEELATIQRRIPLENEFMLVTIHRQENTNSLDRLQPIVEGLNTLAHEIDIVFPIHPRTRKTFQEQGLSLDFEPIDPVGYLDMIQLLKHCKIVATDSGGLQKEAFFFRKPCLTLRDQTEWSELLDLGANRLCGADKGLLISSFHEMRNHQLKDVGEPYGDGKAGETIAEILTQF